MSNEWISHLYNEATALWQHIAKQLKWEDKTTVDTLSMYNLGEYLEQIWQEVFDRYAKVIYDLLVKDIKLDSSTFFSQINPAKFPVFLSLTELEEVSNKLIFLMRRKQNWWKWLTMLYEDGTFWPNSPFVEYYFRWTWKLTISKAWLKPLRKIYINPVINNIPAFIEMFYKLLDNSWVEIHSSKVHLDWTWKDSNWNIVSQWANTFVIYLMDDNQLTWLVNVITETEKLAWISLHKYSKDSLRRTFAVDDRMLVWSDCNHDWVTRSFDHWSSWIWRDTYRALHWKENISLKDVKNFLSKALLDRTWKTPSQYFK